MRAITKGNEPPSLTAHRLTPHCDYNNYREMGLLRDAIVTEQRGICCYCMERIRNGPKTMKVEHWRCQASYPGEQLNYRNLLGACLGGHGQPPHLQHCDTRKGDMDLLWNPADPAHHIETRIRYEDDGSIHSDDAEFNGQLEVVLNLNLARIRNCRKGVLDSVLKWWRDEKARIHGPVPRERFVRERDKRIGGKVVMEPYCPVAEWWLRQRLARMP
jgi:uncharacterized protein (TIGR02646 family)